MYERLAARYGSLLTRFGGGQKIPVAVSLLANNDGSVDGRVAAGSHPYDRSVLVDEEPGLGHQLHRLNNQPGIILAERRVARDQPG